MTTGKSIALTRRNFVGKVTSLLFNTLSMLVIAFLPRSKCLLITWLQSLSTVILEPKTLGLLSLTSKKPKFIFLLFYFHIYSNVCWLLLSHILCIHNIQIYVYIYIYTSFAEIQFLRLFFPNTNLGNEGKMQNVKLTKRKNGKDAMFFKGEGSLF